jgi:hypothetical protein
MEKLVYFELSKNFFNLNFLMPAFCTNSFAVLCPLQIPGISIKVCVLDPHSSKEYEGTMVCTEFGREISELKEDRGNAMFSLRMM